MRVTESFRTWEKTVESEILSLLIWLGASEAPESWGQDEPPRSRWGKLNHSEPKPLQH